MVHSFISETDVLLTPASHRCRFGWRRGAYHVALAVIVRTRTDSGVQQPFRSGAPPSSLFSRRKRDTVPGEIAGLSKMAGLGGFLRAQHAALQKWHTPKMTPCIAAKHSHFFEHEHCSLASKLDCLQHGPSLSNWCVSCKCLVL